MIPQFEKRAVRVILVERKDKPGALGVFASGWDIVCPLPDGYDGETSVVWHDGYVLAAHPSLPSLRCEQSGFSLIDPHHIEAQPGRMRLVTR